MSDFIAASAFAPSGPRAAPVYNRATITLIAAVLFDHTFVIPMSSMVEAPVLYDVFGPFAAARRKLNYRDITPLRLSVDRDRHFDRRASEGLSHVVHRALHAYLCGRAHYKKNLWQGDENEFRRQFNPNFGFIDNAFMEDNGRGSILSLLERNDDSVMEKFSSHIRDHFRDINSYFYASTTPTLDDTREIFAQKSYRDYAAPVIMNFASDLDTYHKDRHYVGAVQKVFDKLDADNRFNMNAMAPVGREYIDEWDKTFQPLINAHRWTLDAKLCGADHSQNIETWGIDNLSVRESVIMALREDGIDEVIDVSVSPDSENVDRIRFDGWEDILNIRRGKGNEFIALINKESDFRKKDIIRSRYIDYAARQLKDVNLLDFAQGRCSLSVSSPVSKTSHAVFNLALTGVGSLAGGLAGWKVGTMVSEADAGYGAIVGVGVGALVKDFTKTYWDDLRRKMAGNATGAKNVEENVRILKLHSAWIDHYDV